ncbi:MAG: hypothetical protein ACOXZ9_10740 [Bacteroidales bacterium]
MQQHEWIRVYDALLRYYMHLNPDSLSDTEWAMRIQELTHIRKEEAKANKI